MLPIIKIENTPKYCFLLTLFKKKAMFSFFIIEVNGVKEEPDNIFLEPPDN